MSIFTGGIVAGVGRLRPSAARGAGKPVRIRRGRATVTGRSGAREPGHRPFAGPTDGTRHPRGGPCVRSPKARRRRLMRRLLLVRHASTAAVRAAAFGADEPLDDGGRAAAARLAARLPRGEVLVSPARRAIETAAGLGPVRIVPELAE